MIASVERYQLALAVLEGEKGANRILADLLEEQGDRGLAQWARAKKNRSRQRLDFVLMLLPCRDVVGLAAETIMDLVAANGRGKNGARGFIDIVAQWCRQECSSEKLLAACAAVRQTKERSPRQIVWKPLEFLAAAATAAEHATRVDSFQGSASPQHWSNEAAQRVRKILRTTSVHPLNENALVTRLNSLLNELIVAGV